MFLGHWVPLPCSWQQKGLSQSSFGVALLSMLECGETHEKRARPRSGATVASFARLCAMQSSPIRLFTFSRPRNRKRRKDQLPSSVRKRSQLQSCVSIGASALVRSRGSPWLLTCILGVGSLPGCVGSPWNGCTQIGTNTRCSPPPHKSAVPSGNPSPCVDAGCTGSAGDSPPGR